MNGEWQNFEVNYCEEDYAVSSDIVEFWNTVGRIFMLYKVPVSHVVLFQVNLEDMLWGSIVQTLY